MKQFYKYFRRKTSEQFIPELDGLRFIAIILVVMHHVQIHYFEKVTGFASFTKFDNSLWYIFQNGDVGVPLFFAISGFILALPFAKHYLLDGKKVPLRKYFWKRITRLEPPYILILIILFTVKVVMGRYSFQELLPHLGASILYLHNIIYNDMSLITPIAWSLEIEVQFYLLAPLLSSIFVLNKQTRRLLIIAVIFVSPILQYTFDIGKLSILGNIQYFLVGFLLCDLYLTKTTIKINKGLYLIGGFLLLIGIVSISIHNFYGKLIYPILIFSFYYLVLNIDFWRSIFQIKWISAIGGMCYSIYLLHFALSSLIGEKSFLIGFSDSYSINIILQILIHLPIILVVTSVYYILIEKPCMDRDWPQKLGLFIKNKFTSRTLSN